MNYRFVAHDILTLMDWRRKVLVTWHQANNLNDWMNTHCFRLRSGSICHLTNIYDQFITHYDFTPPTNVFDCLFFLHLFLILFKCDFLFRMFFFRWKKLSMTYSIEIKRFLENYFFFFNS